MQLTASAIENLVSAFTDSKTSKLVTPLNDTKTKYNNLSTAYSTIGTKLTSLKSITDNLKITGSDSLFKAKSADSSNTNFVTAAANGSASASAYSIRVNQLAKSDLALSSDLVSTDTNAITGSHTFAIKTGDGKGGEFNSNINVTFGASETNSSVLQAISNAINSDKADVTSVNKTAADNYTLGAGKLKIDLNGTETTISYNGGGTYSDLVDELVTNINTNASGVKAEKIVKDGNVNIKITALDSSKYLSISSIEGGDIVSDLGIALNKEKAASATVSASVLTPESGKSQFSLTAKNTGLDYRITSLSDSGSSTSLSSIGMNFGTARTQFVQQNGADVAGFMYSDITADNNLLNSKIVFNGLTLQRNSNTANDIASGVTFTFKSVMQATDTTVNVAVNSDKTSIRKNVEDFVSKFNDIYSYLKSNAAVTKNSRGLLASDANTSSILSTLSSLLYTPVSGLNKNEINMLGQIGISFDVTNGLSISDSSKLDKVITENTDQLENLFNSTNGIANSLSTAFSKFVGSGGYLESAKRGLQTNIKYVSDRITANQDMITKSANSLREKYQKIQAQLDSLTTSASMFSSLISG